MATFPSWILEPAVGVAVDMVVVMKIVRACNFAVRVCWWVLYGHRSCEFASYKTKTAALSLAY